MRNQTKTFLFSNLMVAALLSAAASSSLKAQEETPANAQGEPEFGRSRLHFIDTPIAIESEFDDRVQWPIVEPLPAPEDDPDFQRRMDTIAQYNDSVVTAEQNGGVWNPALVEELSVLGTLHQQQGNHSQAIEVLDRAVHVSRINNGLHTLDQMPAVEQMIESYLATQQWEQADLYYNYMFYVQQKAYGTSDPRIIPILDRLASWNLRAFNIGFGENLGMRLSTAQILFNAAASMVGVHFGKSDERFLRFQQGIANSSYLASQHPELMRELNTSLYRTNEEALLRKLGGVEQAQARGFSSGEKALREIVNFQLEGDYKPAALAEALTNLGDWYLLFRQRKAAALLYADAWKVMSEVENSEEVLFEYYGHVRPIPTFLGAPTTLVFNTSSTKGTSDLSQGFADLEFDVTPNGIVRNLKVVSGETEENGPVLSRLRKEIRNSIFRPVLEDGVAVRSFGNQFRYRYWY